MRAARTLFGVLWKADRRLAGAWWTVLILRGVLPAGFAVATGVLIGAVQRGESLRGPLALAGVIFILLQVLTPLHQATSANLGDRTAAWLYDRLTEMCVRPPGTRALARRFAGSLRSRGSLAGARSQIASSPFG